MTNTLDTTKNMNYVYDSQGRKLRQTTRNGGTNSLTEDYIDNKIYKDNILTKVLIPGGYIDISGTQTSYHYFALDHLGNVRQVLSSNGQQEEQDDCYPFGLRQKRSSNQLNDNKYNGKEQEEFGSMTTLDYGARFYDPQIGRWHVVDPSADEEGQEVASPYCYVENNPISRNDPDGRIWGNIIGAVVGGGVELAGQAIAQMASGKNLSDVDIDWVDVGAATLEGGLTSGGSVLRRVAVTTVSAGVQAAFDDDRNVITGGKSMMQAGKDFAGNMATAGVGAGTQKVVNASTKEAVSSANKQVVRANNTVTTAENRLVKHPNSPKAQTNVNNAKSNAQTARNNQVKTQMTHNTVGQTNVMVKGQKVNIAQQTANTGANAAKNTIVDEKKR